MLSVALLASSATVSKIPVLQLLIIFTLPTYAVCGAILIADHIGKRTDQFSRVRYAHSN